MQVDQLILVATMLVIILVMPGYWMDIELTQVANIYTVIRDGEI